MWASLLPGLRELRSPLAAGYLWLLSGWFVFHETVPGRSEATGLLAATYELGEAFDVIGLGVALSFAAYLLGSLSEGVGTAVVELVRHKILLVGPDGRTLFETAFPGTDMISARRNVALRAFVAERVRDVESELRRVGASFADHPKYQQLRQQVEVLAGRPDDELLDEEMTLAADLALSRLTDAPSAGGALRRYPLTPAEILRHYVSDAIAVEIANDLTLVGTRLIGTHSSLFSQSDRLRAESQFRRAIAPPLVALALVASLEASWWWIFSIAGPPLLLWQARRLQREANDLLVDAVVARTIEAPAVETFSRLGHELAEELRERSVTGQSSSVRSAPQT